MKIFDYLYYRTYGMYLKKNESSPWIYATNLVSLIQFLNLLVLFIIVNKFVIITSDLKFFVIILYLLLFGLNYLKYRKRTFTILNSIWNNENIGCRKRNGVLLVFYILTTLILPILYALLCHR